MSALLGNKYVQLLILIAVILLTVFGIYKFGMHVQNQINDSFNKAQADLIGTLKESLQGKLDNGIDDLSKKMDANFEKLNGRLEDATTKINATKSQLDGLNDVWLRVEDVSDSRGDSSGVGSKGSEAAGSQSGSNGTHYAKLPTTSLQFLKGEAYRGDQCAVRLTSAQQALVQYKGAFETYQGILQDALKQAKLK